MILIPKSNAKSIFVSGSFLSGVMLWRKCMDNKKIDKRIFKKSPEELEQYMQFKRRGSRVESKKGKGSYNRKPKHKKDMYRDCT